MISFRVSKLTDLVVDVSLTSVARGDVLYRGASKWNNLAAGTAGYVLTSGGVGADPSWAAITAAPFDDATAIVKGSSDATKLLRFEVDGFTTGTTRVLTPPNANATLAGLEVANVFTVNQSLGAAGSTLALLWGTDCRLRRRATKTVTFDDGAGGAGGFEVTGTAEITGRISSGTVLSSTYGVNVISPHATDVARFKGASNGDLVISVSSIPSTASIRLESSDIPSSGFCYATRPASGSAAIRSALTGEGVFQLRGDSSTTNRERVAIDAVAVDNTDATRKYRGLFYAYDTAARECMRMEASGTAPMIGFFGHTAAVQPAAYTPTNVSADRSYDANATSVDELADVLGTLIADLQTMGLVA